MNSKNIKQIYNFNQLLISKYLLLLFYIICFFGVCGIIFQLGRNIGIKEIIDANLGLYSWYYPNKPRQIGMYFLAVPIACIYWSVCYYFFHFNKIFLKYFEQKQYILIIFFGITIIANFILIVSKLESIFKILIWLILFIWPIISCKNFNYRSLITKCTYIISSLGIFLAIVFMAYIFIPLIVEKPKFINDFLEVSEMTIMPNGEIVDNFSYINSNNLFGNHKRYDFRNATEDIYESSSIYFSNALKVQGFLKYKNLDKGKIQKVFSLKQNFDYNLYFIYNDKLVLIGSMSAEDYLFLQSIAENEAELNDLNNLYFSQTEDRMRRNLSKEEKAFIKENNLELNWQLIGRGFLHHQNVVYMPYLQMELGKPIEDISFTYGFLNTYFTGNFLKLFGELKIGNQIKLHSLICIAYIFLFLFCLIMIFKNVHYVFINLVVLITACLSINYLYIVMCIGFNPARHFFDILIALFYYFYTSKNNKFFLIFAAILALLSIGINSQFGSFITGALFLVTIIKFIFEKKKFDLYIAITLFILAVPVYSISNIGNQVSATYFLLGFGGAPISTGIILIFIMIISIAYIVLGNFHKLNFDKKYLMLFLVFYIQGIFIYFVTSPQKDHLLPISMIIAFTSSLFVYYIIENHFNKFKCLILFVIVAAIAGIFAFDEVPSYLKSKKKFDKIFRNHLTYEWTFPNTGFISTMNPDYFEDSKVLIERYAQNRNSVYMLSKFDGILLLISNKYNLLSSYDILNGIITAKESNDILKNIYDNQPEYIFVDKDIKRPFEQDLVFYMGTYLHNESLWRLLRLKEIQQIFYEIEFMYEPVESSLLLTVYKRINGE